MTPPPLLEVRDLSVQIAGRALLDGVSLSLQAGELVGVIGPNGAGKTTLLRAITGRVARGGTIHLDGAPIEALRGRERARSVAVVEQLPEAPPTMRVSELAMLGRFPHLGLLGRETSRDVFTSSRCLMPV